MSGKNVADELVAAMDEALAIALGEMEPAAVHHVPIVSDVEALSRTAPLRLLDARAKNP